MASHSVKFTSHIVLLLIVFSSFLLFSLVSSFEFQVGGIKGWIVPPENDSKVYNDWASEERFQVGDTIRFKYKKDSVMEVNEEDYKNCNSTRPNFFSNTGNSIYTLNRSGYFYFISGATGHCQKGQRMIVKVMAEESSDSKSDGHGSTSLGFRVSVPLIIPASIFQFIILFISSYIY